MCSLGLTCANEVWRMLRSCSSSWLPWLHRGLNPVVEGPMHARSTPRPERASHFSAQKVTSVNVFRKRKIARGGFVFLIRVFGMPSSESSSGWNSVPRRMSGAHAPRGAMPRLSWPGCEPSRVASIGQRSVREARAGSGCTNPTQRFGFLRLCPRDASRPATAAAARRGLA